MPEMIRLVLLLCIAAPAHADLYRWIDPETGSVKLSSLPPSDATVGAELVPYRAPAAPKPPVTAPVAAKPAAQPAAMTVEALQARWSELMTQFTGLTPRDFSKGAEGFKQQMAAYDAVRAELDRLDPSGVARRNAQSAGLIEKLRQGFAAQFSAAPPAPPK